MERGPEKMGTLHLRLDSSISLGFQIERREENVSIETVQTWNVRGCKVKEDNCQSRSEYLEK